MSESGASASADQSSSSALGYSSKISGMGSTGLPIEMGSASACASSYVSATCATTRLSNVPAAAGKGLAAARASTSRVAIPPAAPPRRSRRIHFGAQCFRRNAQTDGCLSDAITGPNSVVILTFRHKTVGTNRSNGRSRRHSRAVSKSRDGSGDLVHRGANSSIETRRRARRHWRQFT